MDGWIDGRMYVCMDGWMDGWMQLFMHLCKHVYLQSDENAECA